MEILTRSLSLSFFRAGEKHILFFLVLFSFSFLEVPIISLVNRHFVEHREAVPLLRDERFSDESAARRRGRDRARSNEVASGKQEAVAAAAVRRVRNIVA